MTVRVDIDRASNAKSPDTSDIRRWIQAAWKGANQLIHPAVRRIEISVRIVDEPEMQLLNQTWRGKNKTTNVLSFPSDNPPVSKLNHLGDIVVCAPVIESEAQEQGKSLDAHWAHMCIHGTLHLLGHDHIEDEEASVMENLETGVLATLDFPNPYLHETTEAESNLQ